MTFLSKSIPTGVLQLALTLFLSLPGMGSAQEAQANKSPTAPAAALSERCGTFLIDPKIRSKDYLQALERLRREKPTLKIQIRTRTELLSNVSDLESTDGGTLIFIKIPFNQGFKYLVVPVEDIQELSYSP